MVRVLIHIFIKRIWNRYNNDDSGHNYIEISDYNIEDIHSYRTNWNNLTMVMGDGDDTSLNNSDSDKLIIEGFFSSEKIENSVLYSEILL